MCKKNTEKLVYLPILLYFCSRIMDKEVEKSRRHAIYRRMVYMVVAIVAAALLPIKPVFNFQEDKGIIYVRSFEMDNISFRVIQTEMATGLKEVTEEMSVVGLYICYKAILWGAILCLLCFMSYRWRIIICTIVIVLTGVYYLLIIIYAMKISDIHYATLTPSIIALILPAIVLQAMILTRHSTLKTMEEEADDMEENFTEE